MAAIGKHGPVAGAAPPTATADQPTPLHSTRTYAVATEQSANYGVALDRADQGMDCGSFSGTGFVYSGMWQTINNGQSDWIEAGSSKCDANAGDLKWVAASGINGVYSETFLQYGDLNTSHHWKLSAENGRWKLYIDGELRHDYAGKNYANPNARGDVGLEVNNRPNAVLPATVDDNLLAFIGPENGWQAWSGRDTCHDDAPAKGSWAAADSWKYVYRQDLQGGQRCQT